MTPDSNPNQNPPDDDRDASGDDHWLSSLLDALLSLEELDDRDEYRSTGRRRGDRSTIDYDVSIRSGEDLWDDSERGEGQERTPFRRDRDGGRDGDGAGIGADRSSSSRSRRYSSSLPSSDHHVTTRAYDDELLVTADVAGVDPEEVTVGFDDSTLVVGVADRELERVDVPWDERTAQATIKNGVLAVRVEPDRAESDERGGEDA